MRLPNPFAFRPLQVTFWTAAVYLAIVTPLVTLQESVPRAPAESALPPGISIHEAWADLGNLTQHFHPVNSHANDGVRAFLLARIRQILDANGVSWTTQADRVDGESKANGEAEVVVFDDLRANTTFTTSYAHGRRAGVYYEGSNVYVYIRGTRDAPGPWWQPGTDPAVQEAMKSKLVLVNAHFDSVSSGYGATDDGVGVVTCLQLVRYFTTARTHQPARGVLVLLNNAEEEFLLGATAFARSPLAPYVGTFVNLEGAGAGGRAILFRATDLEVLQAYGGGAPHPAGTVVANDGFKLNMIRSETDYRVWVQALGYRGLDIAFMKPRVRYHTQHDDRRHTSQASVWHMLSAALASAQGLASGAAGDQVERQVHGHGHATDAVWFDLLGDSFVLFALRGLFAWSVTMLVVSPLVVLLVFFLLYKYDRAYMFSSSARRLGGGGDGVPIGGRKGLFCYPLALAASGLVLYGTALLVRKVQPFIVHSSLYAVLALFVSLFYVTFWCLMRAADVARPSALHRAYALLWLYALSWALLVGATQLEDQRRIASGYVVVFWSTSVFAALLVSLLELFCLKTKTAYVEEYEAAAAAAAEAAETDAAGDNASESEILISPSPGERLAAENGDHSSNNDDDDDDAPTETSPLIGGGAARGRPTTFATGYHRSLHAMVEARRRAAAAAAEHGPHAYGGEQAWSRTLPTWTWLLQFLLLAPFHIILVGQLLLTVAAAVHQTGTDGSDLLAPYLLIATFAMLLLTPLTPFVHRATHHHGPLLVGGTVAVGTLVYCLAAFPFSATSPFKLSIRQTFSVDHGNASVTLNGHAKYIHQVIANLPSASGREVTCVDAGGRTTGLLDCTFDATGLEPRVGVVGSADGPGSPFTGSYAGLIRVNASRSSTQSITFHIDATNTKACGLRLARPVKSIAVRGGMPIDTRIDFDPQPAPADDDEDGSGGGSWQLGDFVLWRRDWTTPWVVDVEEEDSSEEGSLTGEVVCRWGDANTPGTAPAVDEAYKYAPAWSILVIRQNPPLVQGTKAFVV